MAAEGQVWGWRGTAQRAGRCQAATASWHAAAWIPRWCIQRCCRQGAISHSLACNHICIQHTFGSAQGWQGSSERLACDKQRGRQQHGRKGIASAACGLLVRLPLWPRRCSHSRMLQGPCGTRGLAAGEAAALGGGSSNGGGEHHHVCGELWDLKRWCAGWVVREGDVWFTERGNSTDSGPPSA